MRRNANPTYGAPIHQISARSNRTQESWSLAARVCCSQPRFHQTATRPPPAEARRASRTPRATVRGRGAVRQANTWKVLREHTSCTCHAAAGRVQAFVLAVVTWSHLRVFLNTASPRRLATPACTTPIADETDSACQQRLPDETPMGSENARTHPAGRRMVGLAHCIFWPVRVVCVWPVRVWPVRVLRTTDHLHPCITSPSADVQCYRFLCW